MRSVCWSITGVWSSLKSPVWTTGPSGVWMMSPQASGMLWATVKNSTSKMSAPNSKVIMLRPISPRPPRGMTRRVPAGIECPDSVEQAHLACRLCGGGGGGDGLGERGRLGAAAHLAGALEVVGEAPEIGE